MPAQTPPITLWRESRRSGYWAGTVMPQTLRSPHASVGGPRRHHRGRRRRDRQRGEPRTAGGWWRGRRDPRGGRTGDPRRVPRGQGRAAGGPVAAGAGGGDYGGTAARPLGGAHRGPDLVGLAGPVGRA